MTIPKIRIRKNSLYPHLWSAYWQIGGLKLMGWGSSPMEAYKRILHNPTATNAAGGRIWCTDR